MISKYEKTNGVKLLAAFMVMAMVVAGAAVMLSDESVDAASANDTGVTNYVDGTTDIAASGKYYVSGEIKNAIVVDQTGVILYLANNTSVDLTGSTAANVTIRIASGFSNGTVTYDDSFEFKPTTIGTYSVSDSVLKTADTAASGSKVGISLKSSNNTFTYYGEGANQSINLANYAEVKITNGTATPKTLDDMQYLATVIKNGALCALGQTAANPILSTMVNFPEEYKAHVEEKKCPAHVCKKLTRYKIVPELCKKCSLCARNCPVQCISGVPGKEPYHIDQSRCIKCGACMAGCRFHAIVKE